MEQSGSNNKNVNYSDLNIGITSDGLSVSVYLNTDNLNFHVVSLTFPHGNIPMEIGYNIFFSQILRYGNICTNLYLPSQQDVQYSGRPRNLGLWTTKLSSQVSQNKDLVLYIFRCIISV